MLNDCNYNLVLLLNDLSRVAGYVDRHCKDDAAKAEQPLTQALMDEIHNDLEKNIEKLRQAVEGLAKEGKFN